MKHKIDDYFEMPYRLIDTLPERVPADAHGQYFRIEQFYLQPEEKRRIFRRFADLLLKLNCYYGIQLMEAYSGSVIATPAPALLHEKVMGSAESVSAFLILIPEEDAVIALDSDCLHLTVYNPSAALSALLEKLSAAEGLFFRA